MSIFLKDVAFKDFEKESMALYSDVDSLHLSLFNDCLYGDYNTYIKYGKIINKLDVSDELRKEMHDSNLVLYIARNKLISNFTLTHTYNISIDYTDDCIYYGDTIFGDVKPNKKFLSKLCKKHGISFTDKENSLEFGPDPEEVTNTQKHSK